MISGAEENGSPRYVSLFEISPHLTVLVATILSFIRTGYLPIDNNNIYHLPILLRSFDQPQFADDAFIQSLRNFASGFWILFSGAGHIINVKLFLGGWLLITHWAFLAAALHLAESLGFRDRKLLNVYLLIVSIAGPFIGVTVGGGGVMLHYFTHSELANASLLFGFSFAMRGGYGHAAVATALTFFLNAFMAVWMIWPLCFLAIYQMRNGAISLRALLVRGTMGSAIGLIFLLLPIANMLSSRQLFIAPPFPYRQFLRDFYPFHFFLESNGNLALINLLCAVVATFAACRILGRQAKPLCILAWGAIAVLVIGTMVPLWTDSRTILNLHLIRSAVVIIIFFGVAASLLAAKWLTESEGASLKLYGWAACAALMPLQFSAALVLALSTFYRMTGNKASSQAGHVPTAQRMLFWFVPIVALLILPSIYLVNRDNVMVAGNNAEWERLGEWAKEFLPQKASFMVMPSRNASGAALGFEYTSDRRQIFADKYGAAVLWSPAYFNEWDHHMRQRKVISTPRDKLDYAVSNGADYLGTECDQVFGNPIHQDGGSCLYALTQPVASMR
ncbi:hypothetical protein ACXHMN_18835 [Rhizobium sp. LEGMi12c]